MAYETLTQMTTHMLDPVRGWWDERQLSRVCPVNSNAAVVAGSVGFLNSSNEFELGSAAGNKMPLFARGGTADNDARRVEGNISGMRATATQGTPAVTGTAGGPVGISCLVGTGAYELGTTEFVASGITAGDLLMASTGTAGKVAKWVATTTSLYTTAGADALSSNTNQVIGIATSGANGVFKKNQYGVDMLYFYVNWWPAI